ncbi:hypothetical protein EFW17_16110 [Halostreptopolyspora alba]|uniref:Beta-lactamase class A catalytic domain-containing protein n=1 Tax=Halostreptopolyspora alba TaxID=2487137 RepID=A0A3N0E6Y1_9ACTN|nr:hypothetical protein EFW17_16110 [Nocardiopsaceae bacterium YIM 96095]
MLASVAMPIAVVPYVLEPGEVTREDTAVPPPRKPDAGVGTDDVGEPRLSPEDKDRISDVVEDYMADREGRIAVAVQELTTGATYDYRADREFITGSLVKLDILTLMLLRAEDEDRDLTQRERDLAGKMIRYSDNEVADVLFADIGYGSGLLEGNERFGLRDTEPNPANVWGATTTTAADQRRLLRAVFTDTGPLSERSREFVAELLGDVAPEQAWGVSVAAADDGIALLKNGWVPIEDHGGRWVINSAGHVVSESGEYLIVVLSDRHGDYASGVECVEHVAGEVTREIEETLAAEGGLQRRDVPDAPPG